MGERRVVVVMFPLAQMLDVSGPVEVFAITNWHLQEVGYRTTVVSADGGMLMTTSGLELSTTATAEINGPIDTLLIAGGRGKFDAAEDDHLIAEIRRLAGKSTRVASVCTGAFVLAAAGLLDDRRATTHWRWCPDLATRYPRVRVDPDAIYVRDGDVWTSAGITAGIDLALALVADDHGQKMSATVARELVVYLRRAGGQTQFSAPLSAQVAEREPLRDLLDWINAHPDDDLSVAALARRMHLSDRQLSRVFKAELGVTPGDHVEMERVEAARRLLETTAASIEVVAKQTGFGVTETMQRAFRRRLHTTPAAYRRHFTEVR